MKVDCPGLGDRIKAARKADPRSVQALAGAIGKSLNYWYLVEGDETQLSEETLRKIEAVLGVDFGVEFPPCAKINARNVRSS
jgi:transcriptional regulator with XRE-family HTH domain